MVTKLIHPSDLAGTEWQKIKCLAPKARDFGRPRSHSLREILNAIFYVLRSGCIRRLLPHDYAPGRRSMATLRHTAERPALEPGGTLIGRVHERLRAAVRKAGGRTVCPSAAVLDSQSVRTPTQAGVRGCDAGKKIKGRKRHLLVDTPGLLPAVQVPRQRAGSRRCPHPAPGVLLSLSLAGLPPG